MFLARREAGKALQIYPVVTTDEPSGWMFCGVNDAMLNMQTQAAAKAGMLFGCAATGYTRSEAITNLHAVEEAAAHA